MVWYYTDLQIVEQKFRTSVHPSQRLRFKVTYKVLAVTTPFHCYRKSFSIISIVTSHTVTLYVRKFQVRVDHWVTSSTTYTNFWNERWIFTKFIFSRQSTTRQILFSQKISRSCKGRYSNTFFDFKQLFISALLLERLSLNFRLQVSRRNCLKIA